MTTPKTQSTRSYIYTFLSLLYACTVLLLQWQVVPSCTGADCTSWLVVSHLHGVFMCYFICSGSDNVRRPSRRPLLLHVNLVNSSPYSDKKGPHNYFWRLRPSLPGWQQLALTTAASFSTTMQKLLSNNLSNTQDPLKYWCQKPKDTPWGPCRRGGAQY